jgi:hypothetical protein
MGIEVSSGVGANGFRYAELTQTDCIEHMHAEANRFLKDNYKVSCPISKEKDKSLTSAILGGTVLKPPLAEYTKNLDHGYRTVVGMLLWVQRNTKVDISTSMAYVCRVMSCPSDITFECMLQVVQWVYHERHTRLKYISIFKFTLQSCNRFEDHKVVPPIGWVLLSFEIFIQLGLNQVA